MKPTTIKASAIIPFYGNPDDTLELISQLQAQTIADELEIIVSDDCSPHPFPETEGVRVLRRESNGGFGANVNTGVSQAEGKWLFILNSDLSLPEDFLERAIEVAESFGDVVLAPQVLGHDGKSQMVGRKFPRTRHIVWEWLSPLARVRRTDFWHFMVGHDLRCKPGKTVEVDWVMGACMAMRLDTFKRIGGMDERYFMNSEEVDLQRRLAERGTPRIFAGDLTVNHIGGASSGDELRRRQWVLNSRFIYADKWNTSKHLGLALRVATYMNYGFNKIRSVRNPEVTPEETKRLELEAIKNAEAKAGSIHAQYGF